MSGQSEITSPSQTFTFGVSSAVTTNIRLRKRKWKQNRTCKKNPFFISALKITFVSLLKRESVSKAFAELTLFRDALPLWRM